MPKKPAVLSALLLACAAQLAAAQQTAERFIPVGAYPNVADRYLWACTLVAVDAAASTITVRYAGSEQRLRVTDDTAIWLDRSRLRLPPADARLADLTPGLQAEVRTLGPESADVARWIKVQAASP